MNTTFYTFKAPKHWVVVPQVGTISDMETNKEYFDWIMQLYEKANEFYNMIEGRTRKVSDSYLKGACVILAQEYFSQFSDNAAWKTAIRKQGDKIRKRLGIGWLW